MKDLLTHHGEPAGRDPSTPLRDAAPEIRSGGQLRWGIEISFAEVIL